jgi:HEAT repeat protein
MKNKTRETGINQNQRIKGSILVLMGMILIGLIISGCDAQVEKNIEILRSAQYRLEANPNDDEALSTILKLLRDRNDINRGNAAAVLGEAAERVGGSIKEKALPPLIKLLDEGNKFDKRESARAIRGFGVHAVAAISVLRKNLFPSYTDTALFSAEALGRIGEPAAIAVPELLRVIEERAVDPESDFLRIRESAAHSIGQIGPKANEATLKLLNILGQTKDVEFKIKLATAVIRIDPGNMIAISAIDAIMKSPDTDTRQRMIFDLEDAGDGSRPVLSIIKAATTDSDEDVRRCAKRLLTRLENNK